jgi:hypothetical protein
MRVLGGGAVGELVQVGLAHVPVAGGLEPAHGFGCLGRHVVGEEDRAVRGDETRGVEEVLDGEPAARLDVAAVVGPREEDALGKLRRRSHSLVTVPSQTRAPFPDTIASGRRPGEP